MSLSDSQVKALGQSIADTMMLGAARFIRSRNIQPNESQLQQVCDALKARKQKAVDEMFAESRSAVDAGMHGFVDSIARTTLVQHGIEAAQSVFPEVRS